MFDNDGTMFGLTEDANLVKISDFESVSSEIFTAKTTLVADLGIGRPLGGKFSADNTLWIADAVLGLTRLRDPSNPKSKVEIVATKVLDDGVWTRLGFPDDVAVGPKTGMIYFTDGKEAIVHCSSILSH